MRDQRRVRFRQTLGLASRFFWSGFRLCRYDKSWKIYSFSSDFAGPLSGTVVGKTTASEYEARLQ